MTHRIFSEAGQRAFWVHVDKTDTCWLWTGLRYRDGYGKYGGRPAHRRAYLLTKGPITQGLELDHLCGVIACVNPDHLEPVARAENMRRRYASQTHCKRGHEFTPENTYTGAGNRRCRACQRVACARYQARRAAA